MKPRQLLRVISVVVGPDDTRRGVRVARFNVRRLSFDQVPDAALHAVRNTVQALKLVF